MSKVGTVVIVGRMNVGKSTLFNRLSVNVKSITLDYEGVTRDFIKDRVQWQGSTFDLIDSGGITLRKIQDPLLEQVRQKVLGLIETADVIIFVVDATVGLLPEDREISKYLHKLGKPVLLVVNKVDSKRAQETIYEFERLGHTIMILVSAQHGTGIHDLLEQTIAHLPKKAVAKEETKPTYKVILLGKPNVGKSSLMNMLVKEERSLVSDIPGTTREALSEQITFYKEPLMLTDTPGVRRKRAVSEELETLMVKSSFAALKDSDIVVLLIDGSSHTLVDQELKLAFYAFTDHYKALILLINKQDLMTEVSKKDLEYSFEYYRHLIDKIPVLSISCKTGKNVGRVLPLIHKVWERHSRRIEDAELNRLFISALQKKPLFHKTKRLQVHEVKQIGIAPITIHMKVNEPDWFGPSQLAFFENIMRSEYDMIGVPVKFVIRKSAYAKIGEEYA
jgi:GTPase